MSERPIRLGLIGAGRWGRIYIKTLDRLEGIELARLASSNPESHDLVGEDCVVTEDWRAVAIADDLDGVIIATPPALHAEMAITAIAANKPVLVEKPLTLDVDEAENLLRIATAEKAIVHVDHVHLYHPAYRELKRLGSGMGPVRAIRGCAGAWGPFRDDTSLLWDWGAHDVAMALDLLESRPETVSAQRKERRETPEGVGESIALQLTFPGNVTVDIEISNLLDKKQRLLEVHFDCDILIYDGVGSDALVRQSGPDERANIDVPDILPLDQAVMDFVQAIDHGEADVIGLKLGVDVVKVLKACEEAL